MADLLCWDTSCRGRVDIREDGGDKIAFCDRCRLSEVYVGMAVCDCRVCGCEIVWLHTDGFEAGKKYNSCKHASDKTAWTDRPSRVFPFSMAWQAFSGSPIEVWYCGRDYFSGLEDDVQISKRAIEKLGSAKRRFFGFLPGKIPRSMYLRRTAEFDTRKMGIPVTSVGMIHAYCNFAVQQDHNNAKIVAPVGAYLDGEIFRMFLREHGLVNIICEDKWVHAVMTGARISDEIRSRMTII